MLALSLAFGSALNASAQLAPGPAKAPPSPTQTITVPGLAAPAQILVDTWGVPHIYAASDDDVFFVQGFNAARDRLFQIDLWRRRGLGQLAAVFGPNFVEQDRAARLFLYRGDMAKEWAVYGRNAQRIAARFAAGINAYIDLTGREPARLPFEFSHFGYRPEKWAAEDVVRIRSHGLTRNVASEMWRAAVACRADLAADEVRSSLSPPWQTQMPVGLNPCLAPEALRVFGLATQGVSVSPSDVRRAQAGGALDPLPEPTPKVAVLEDASNFQGSNAWVVGPARSATGRPILASDPHRLHSAPSLRYIVHLNAPGLNVIGGGEPALPGVSIGHNGTVAFGLTIFAIDQEDLYVYDTRSAGFGEPASLEYRYQGRWEKLRVVKETVAVRGRPAQPVELLFTRHGPVTFVDSQRQRAYAVRTGWAEPGMAPYFGSIDYMRAKNFKDFQRAMAKWGAPAENQVYADTAGNIAWVTGGLAPKRPNWDGLLPVPGDGRFEWAGFWTGAELPWVLNPKQGWFATANEQNLHDPHDSHNSQNPGNPPYPWRERKLGFEWTPPWRFQRIAEVLRGQPKHSLEDAMRLQNDLLSVPARRLLALIKPLAFGDAKAQQAQALLGGWDAQVRGDSAAAALYQVWWSRHLGAALRARLLTPAAAALIRHTDEVLLMQMLEGPQGTPSRASQPSQPSQTSRWGADAVAKRNAVLETSLSAAWADMQTLGGGDPGKWQWSRLHQGFFPHALASAADAATQARLNVGPVPKQGGGETVNMSGYDPATFRQFAGASFRLVLDVGAWDNSRAVNAPGQSGDPASPHYRDLVPLWLKGEYFPLLYSREAVEAAVAQRIELVPGR